MERYFGRKVTLAPTSLTAEEFSAQGGSTMAPEDRVKRDALEHPAVKSVLTILGGQVEEVTVLGETCSEDDPLTGDSP